MKNENYYMEIINAQGHGNRLTKEHFTAWIQVNSAIGLSKEAHTGMLLELPIIDKGVEDFVMFMIEDLISDINEDGTYKLVMKLKCILRADQNGAKIVINQLPGGTLIINKDHL